MACRCDHTLHGLKRHHGWDNALAPALTIQPGETVSFDCADCFGGQLTAQASPADIMKLDLDKANPLTGPVFVDGAEPGDALKITIEAFEPSGLGWTANIPGFGLLADQFPHADVHVWTYDKGLAPAAYGPGGRVPLKPFAGTIGCAPAAPGTHSVVPPRRVGGNLDIRDLSAGTTLHLPVEVPGALFSIGDTHAAQGDGEVCGTAIESAMTAALTIELVKDARLKTPRFSTPGPVTRHLDGAGYEATTGVGPDLMTAAREATMRMVELLGAWRGLSAIDAYMLCSVCGDLRISEIVDAPNWVVSFYFPRIVFE